MKHTRSDYNRIQDPENKIPEDEPVFLIRGQDVLAPAILITYAVMLRSRYKDETMARFIEAHAEKMITWQREHGASIPNFPTGGPG